MNQYQLSFFLRLPGGEVRGATQLVVAASATLAILQLQTMPWPGVLVGGITWTLVGPRLAPPRHAPPVTARHHLSPLRAA